jgi:4-amino-4-deoxy-L-arabinose transferase-like glycosyltransferase
MNTPPSQSRRSIPPLVWPLLFGLVLRVTLALTMPLDSRVTGDTPDYLDLARNLLAGHGYSTSAEAPYLPSIARPPSYPLFIALVWGLVGESLLALSVAQLVLDTLTTGLLYALARRRLGPKIALTAAWLHAALPFTAGTSIQYMSEPLAMALVVFAAYAQTRAVEESLLWAALSGLAWGAAFLARPYLGPLIVVAAAVLWLEIRRSDRAQKLRGALAFVAVGVGSALVATPWVLRNALLPREPGAKMELIQSMGSRPPFSKMYTPGFIAWLGSYEEPIVWLNWQLPPEANYQSPAEKQAVETLWQYIRTHDGEVTPEMNVEFQRVADERYRAAPLRLRVWRPISMALKYWLSPRLSSLRFSVGAEAGLPLAGKGLAASFLLLNLSFTGLALLGILRARREYFLWALPAAVTVTLAALAQREARMVMPVFPLVALSASLGLWAAADLLRIIRSRRGSGGRPPSPAPAPASFDSTA